MTARRVINDHNDLDSVGSLTHDQIDGYVNTSPFVVLSGVVGTIPPQARLLRAGAGVSFVDSGPSAPLVVSVTSSDPLTPRFLWMETPSGVINGVNTTFTLAQTPNPAASLMLYWDGIFQKQGDDYTLTENVIDMLAPPDAGDVLATTYMFKSTAPSSGIETAWFEQLSGSVNGVNDTFSLAHTPEVPADVLLFIDGLLQRQGDDFVLTGSSVTVVYPPVNPTTLLAKYTYRAFTSSSANIMWIDIPTGDVNGVNDQFILSNTPDPASALMFYVNGLLQKQGATEDYAVLNDTVTMSYVPLSGSNVTATYPY